MTLQGQVALVTGASRGIGQAIALELGRQGATVIGTATSDSGAQAIGAYLDAAGIKGAGMALNVNDTAQTEQVLAELRKQFGEISILVNKRRHHPRQSAGTHDRRRVGRCAGDQSQIGVPSQPRRAARDDEGQGRAHHQHFFGNWQYGQRRTGQLRRFQSGHGRFHQVYSPRKSAAAI